MRSRLMVFLAATLVASCASGGGSSTARGSRDIIRFEEIEPLEVSNAFEVIQRLRPEMLRPRSGMGGAGSVPTAEVYMDGVRHGDVSQLQTLPKEIVLEVRFISAADATTRFGTGHAGGVIMITTRRGG